MFRHILVPVDLLHLDKLDRALAVAAEEARLRGARVTYVSVSISAPSRVASGPDAFRKKLERFAADQARHHSIDTNAQALFSNDPSTDVDDTLLKAIEDLGADLVIMASHTPGIAEYFWPSNGGKIASHSKASVFLVRGS